MTPEDYKEKYTLSKRCCVEDTPDAHTVWLRVEGQAFCVTSIACDTKEDAEWTRLMLAKALCRIAELESGTPTEWAITGSRLRCLIAYAHRLLGRRYKTSPLWALVSDLTWYGSTSASELCREVGYDPHQPCNTKQLKTAPKPTAVAAEKVLR